MLLEQFTQLFILFMQLFFFASVASMEATPLNKCHAKEEIYCPYVTTGSISSESLKISVSEEEDTDTPRPFPSPNGHIL